MRPDMESLISKADALKLLFDHWTPAPGTEPVPVGECAGRVLAADQYARYDIPVVRASMMDGVAVKSALFRDGEGLPDTSGWRLGNDFVRADTGDDFDDAYDAVIAIEDVTLTPEGGIEIRPDAAAKVAPGCNVKPRGAEVRKGALLAKAGTLLTAGDMAAIAMGGAAEVEVLKKPRVGFIPTGSELAPVGSELRRGQNFDSNSPLVRALLLQMGAEPVMHPIVRDDPAALREAVATLLPQCDILLLNAGTSKGGEDYCAAFLAEQGSVLFHGVAAVPGRPMSMAVLDGKAVVNLSGPAFAAFYGVDWAVRPLVCRWLGQPLPRRQTVTARLTGRLAVPPRFSAMTAFRVRRDGGKFIATPLAGRGPGGVGSAGLLAADAVYVSTPGEAPREAGDEIALILLRDAAALEG